MPIKNYGMPTLIETNTLCECARLCAELGLDFIELNMNLPQYQLQKTDADYFKRIATQYGIYYTIHLDENLNVCDLAEIWLPAKYTVRPLFGANCEEQTTDCIRLTMQKYETAVFMLK